MEKYRIIYEAAAKGSSEYTEISAEDIAEGRIAVKKDILLPADCDVLRIRWEGAQGCILYHLRVTAETDTLDIASNAAHVDGVTFLFDTVHPAMTMASGKKGDHMEITYDLRLLSEDTDRERLDALAAAANPVNPVHESRPSDLLAKISEQQRVLDETQRILDATAARLEEVDRDYGGLKAEYEKILNSPFWKVSGPARHFLSGVRQSEKPAEEEPAPKKTETTQETPADQKRLAAERIVTCDEEELEKERAHRFARPVTISILVPLYNTPEKYLRELIESVQAQTYGGWELCLADASDAAHGNVEETVREFSRSDSRIAYHRLAGNEGIALNTNACAALAKGTYFGLLDHDDLLHPSALFDAMKAIEEKHADFVYSDEMIFNGDDLTDLKAVHYKPDYAYDDLLGNNYICHFSVFRRDLFEKAGMFRTGYDGSQDHDLFLRLCPLCETIVHVPEVRYYWRSHAGSTASAVSTKSYAILSGYRAVHDHLKERGFETEVLSYPKYETVYRIRYQMKEKPRVTVIIPNKDHYALLKNCIDSILLHTDYENYEILIVDNGSTQASVLHYYRQLEAYGSVRVIRYDQSFNYAAINNFAVQHAKGDLLLFLNNDTEVIAPEWMDEMAAMAVQERIGCVGALLLYKDKTIQHGGVILGPDRENVASHAFLFYPGEGAGYMSKLLYVRDTMAVTAACMMMRRDVFEKTGGFDAETFAVAYNDIDLCLKAVKAGYTNVMVPWAKLYHYESQSRGSDQTPENIGRFRKEIHAFAERWGEWIDRGDPYYNKHLRFVPTYTYEGGED